MKSSSSLNAEYWKLVPRLLFPLGSKRAFGRIPEWTCVSSFSTHRTKELERLYFLPRPKIMHSKGPGGFDAPFCNRIAAWTGLRSIVSGGEKHSDRLGEKKSGIRNS